MKEKESSDVVIGNQFCVGDQLNRFKSHTLSDLKGAALMDRVDTKFLLHRDLLPRLLDKARQHYTALEIGGRRCFQYSSVYYDTTGLKFYNMHYSGRLNRFKVRVREYVDSQTKFLEVKFKNNKKRTVKKRMLLNDVNGEDISQCKVFLDSLGVPSGAGLMQVQRSEYQRIALASEERKERVTIDINLESTLVMNDLNEKVALPTMAIVELKQEKVDRSSPFYRILKELGVRKGKYSKYCMGMVMTGSDKKIVRGNRFKRIQRRVKAVCDSKAVEV